MNDPAAILFACLLHSASIEGPAGIGSSVSVLTETEKTKHFVVFYKKGSKAGAAVDRIGWRIEEEYQLIGRTLDLGSRVDDREPFYLFLYDSTDELAKITGTEGTGGFSAARESHVPFDNDQTRLHEMVHIVMAAVKETGPDQRNMFFAEGIANAVLRFVHGVPVHAVAAYERRRRTLPSIATLTGGDFYDYLKKNPSFNGYDIGGSFFLFLLETYGPKKVVDYCKGRPPEKSLGVSIAAAEERWLRFLDGYSIRPELVTLLQERRGDPGPFGNTSTQPLELTAEILGSPAEWRALSDDLKIEESDVSFRREGGKVIAQTSSGKDWVTCEAPQQNFRVCMVRATIRPIGKCWGVQLRLGTQFQAMILGQGSFLYFQEKSGIAFTDLVKLEKDAPVDLLLIVHDGAQEVWINGKKWLDAHMPADSGRIGIGVVGGKAEFSDLKVRQLK